MAQPARPTVRCPVCRAPQSVDTLAIHIQTCREEVAAELAASLALDDDIVYLFKIVDMAARPPAPLETSAPDAGAGLPAADGSSTNTCSALMIVPQPSCDVHEDAAQCISPGLWLGEEAAALSAQWLRAHGIAAVLNCAADCEPLPHSVQEEAGLIAYGHVPLVDTAQGDHTAAITAAADQLAALRATVAASSSSGSSSSSSSSSSTASSSTTEGRSAKRRRRGGEGNGDSSSSSGGSTPAGVLVHCAAGVSRSATVVIAHLMRHAGLTLRQAAGHVKAARPCVYPNLGFWRALMAIERAAAAGAAAAVAAASAGTSSSGAAATATAGTDARAADAVTALTPDWQPSIPFAALQLHRSSVLSRGDRLAAAASE